MKIFYSISLLVINNLKKLSTAVEIFLILCLAFTTAYSHLLINIDIFGLEKNNMTKDKYNETNFSSAFDSFVSSIPQGYGSYEIEKSNIFQKNDTIILYVEPVGFKHQLKEFKDGKLFIMNFTVDLLISNANGELLERIEKIPTKEVISHHENKEVYIIIEFRPYDLISGKYYLQYFITDKNSGKSFEIVKDILIK